MKKMKLLILLAVLTVSALLLTGFGRIDQASLAAAGSSAALKASDGKDKVKLTVDEAKKISFDDAGVTETDVVLEKAGLTTDDGVVKYEVEFYYKKFEYEYDIDPDSGKITDSDKDPMDAGDYQKMKLLQKKSAEKPSVNKEKVDKLTLKDAKKIAFDDAGVKEKDIVLKKAGLTTDDGIDIYEIEFYYKDFEYEYDIDPKTGIITDLDRDPMDAEDRAKMEAIQKAADNKTAGDDAGINEEKAFEIAIAHAKVSAADTYEKEVKLDYDEDLGKEVYEVEFKAGGMEYSYDIDPDTGEVLEYESEADD